VFEWWRGQNVCLSGGAAKRVQDLRKITSARKEWFQLLQMSDHL
jgi:ADP-dependent phosphofructokinase/glucokinase